MLKVCGMIPFEFSLAENDGPQGKRRDCEKKNIRMNLLITCKKL